MALHQLAISKASFSAGLLRPDPTSIPRDEISHLHGLLDAAVTNCSPVNIQHCKDWLLRYTISSSSRITAFGKYLVALSASFAESEDRTSSLTERSLKPSPRRRRLHILYLLNDLLHHTKYHNESSSAFSTLSGTLQPHLVELLDYAASYQSAKCPNHHRRIGALLDIWERQGYYNSQYIKKLRESAENAADLDSAKDENADVETNGKAGIGSNRASMKNVPFVMPATHGDPSTPYYDLPAGNMMPHIVPNSAIPINPKLVKPLQFVAGPADDSLVNSLKDFMKEVEHIDGIGVDFDGGGMLDFDELGQACAKDPVSGEIIDGEGYYGWSRGFCQKMKRRKAGKVASNPSGRTRSTSSDRDVGRRKRRRDHSGSRSGRSSGHGRSRFSSFSRSRSKSPDRTLMKRYGQQEKRYSRSRSKSGSSSRSRSPPQRYRSLRSRSRTSPRSRSKSYSPPHELPPEQDPDPYEYNPGAIPDRPHGPSRPGPPQLPANFGQGFPLGPGGIPIPPPPPPNHTGPWPPPPPPIPAGINFIPQPGQFPPLFPGFVPPHIPGPPSGPRNPPGQVPHGSGRWSQQQQYQQQGGRGGYGGYGPSDPGAVHNYNGRGRGGPRGAWRS